MGYEIFLEEFVKPSGPPSYIPNVRSLRSWVINKNVKNECVETMCFWFLQITQDLNKIKKSRPLSCRHWLLGNMCKISAKNIELYGSCISSKFSKTKELCLNFYIGFWITKLVLSNHNEINQ